MIRSCQIKDIASEVCNDIWRRMNSTIVFHYSDPKLFFDVSEVLTASDQGAGSQKAVLSGSERFLGSYSFVCNWL
jgi:hypothetical protein